MGISINCKIPSTFLYMFGIFIRCQKNPSGCSCCSCSKGQSVKTSVPDQGPFTFPAHFPMSHQPHATLQPLTSSSAAEGTGSLPPLNLHTCCHFFLEYSSLALTSGKTLAYPFSLNLISSRKLGLHKSG